MLNGDEIGQLAASLEQMRQNLQQSMSEIHMAADQVAAGARNVSDASVSLSQGAAEQASSVEELSSSISEISSQTASNAGIADPRNEWLAGYQYDIAVTIHKTGVSIQGCTITAWTEADGGNFDAK